ncbi:hypothetical protein NC653_012358 [Populus alba x Populus x berolinensis]|uniref:Uncharacterized protein n=1 Tax=Populus alba x Populus x berolinensis TaxID=444605 RepID=A0AAD6R4N5_9ROSI|nr:hypothetical protein NC653_012358 [Populus alba x Populus x berolinensis]
MGLEQSSTLIHGAENSKLYGTPLVARTKTLLSHAHTLLFFQLEYMKEHRTFLMIVDLKLRFSINESLINRDTDRDSCSPLLYSPLLTKEPIQDSMPALGCVHLFFFPFLPVIEFPTLLIEELSSVDNFYETLSLCRGLGQMRPRKTL